MARVKVTSTVTSPGGRTLKVKRVANLLKLVESSIEATTVQNRVLAEESRELIVDRVFAGTPTPPGIRIAQRPPRLRAVRMPTANASRSARPSWPVPMRN